MWRTGIAAALPEPCSSPWQSLRYSRYQEPTSWMEEIFSENIRHWNWQDSTWLSSVPFWLATFTAGPRTRCEVSDSTNWDTNQEIDNKAQDEPDDSSLQSTGFPSNCTSNDCKDYCNDRCAKDWISQLVCHKTFGVILWGLGACVSGKQLDVFAHMVTLEHRNLFLKWETMEIWS